ncbi:MAG: ATP-binding protein [Armatimonadetes bacterium]|nr:ATP-binding protein [Armatimonadota bacterium]
MTCEELLYRYNPWWEGEFAAEGVVERPEALEALRRQLTTPQVVLVTGLRRVGKTTLLKLLARELIATGKADPRHVLYVSLDDYRLAAVTILDLLEEYRKLHRFGHTEPVIAMLDEVAHQPDYEQQLKNLCDMGGVKVYASSSSSSLMRSRKSHLTGRNVIVEILPLDFQEYLRFKAIRIRKSDVHLRKRYFEDYLRTGGIPEYVLRGDIEYLKELVDDILHKDIAAQHGVRDTQLLKDLFLLLMERSGKTLSINKVARVLSVTPDSARRYVEMFASTYLIHLVPRSGKTNERILSPKKVYACDLGVRTLYTGFRDVGSLFENYVYLRLRHKQPAYLYQDGTEIDFRTSDRWLVEAKYHDEEMAPKQQNLFDQTPGVRKAVVRNEKDVEELFSGQEMD